MKRSYITNWPALDCAQIGCFETENPALKRYDEPHWHIFRKEDGSIEIGANRPTDKEACNGDNGKWSSVIILSIINKQSIKNALRLARRLCTCGTQGIIVPKSESYGIEEIQTMIPWAIHEDC